MVRITASRSESSPRRQRRRRYSAAKRGKRKADAFAYGFPVLYRRRLVVPARHRSRPNSPMRRAHPNRRQTAPSHDQSPARHKNVRNRRAAPGRNERGDADNKRWYYRARPPNRLSRASRSTCRRALGRLKYRGRSHRSPVTARSDAIDVEQDRIATDRRQGREGPCSAASDLKVRPSQSLLPPPADWLAWALFQSQKGLSNPRLRGWASAENSKRRRRARSRNRPTR